MTVVTGLTILLLILTGGLGVATIILCEYLARREEKLKDKQTSRHDQS